MEHIKEKSSKVSAALVLTGTAALTIAGAIIIPPLLRKYSNKLYKSSIKKLQSQILWDKGLRI